jgi:protein-L-isoaspartate(D-aspartate) O-methyltransferase
LNIRDNELVLDLGCGLGYSAAVIARMAEAVVAVEDRTRRWRPRPRSVLSGAGADNVAVICAPLTEGAPKHGPYDVITVQGGVEQVPETIGAQLKEGGRIVCLFMEGALGVVRVGWKRDGQLAWRDAFNAAAPVLPGFERQREFTL